MKNSKLINAFLVVAGLIGAYVGIGLLCSPVDFQAANNINIGDNISHLNDTRATGMMILSTSFIIFLAAFKHSWRYIGIGLAALLFTTYGIGRVCSIIIDGMPAEGLFYAMISELVIGLIAVVVLLKIKKG